MKVVAPDGYNGSVFNADTVFITQNFIVQESTRQAGGVAQGIDKVALLVALHIDNAVRTVHAHVRGFYRDIDNRPYAAAADFIVSLL